MHFPAELSGVSAMGVPDRRTSPANVGCSTSGSEPTRSGQLLQDRTSAVKEVR